MCAAASVPLSTAPAGHPADAFIPQERDVFIIQERDVFIIQEGDAFIIQEGVGQEGWMMWT